MTVERIEFLVEEPSMEAALRQFLPRIVGELPFRVHAHEGKDDLLAKLPNRLRGYSKWIPKTWRILVLVDRDDDPCDELIGRLEKVATDAGLVTKAAARNRPWVAVCRLAIEELEAWYFGDWAAVRLAYPRVPATIPRKAKYRDPDAIAGGTWEAFERILQEAGYFKGGLEKIAAARTVCEHMTPETNCSNSFRKFFLTLGELAAE